MDYARVVLWLLESDVFAVGPHPLTTAVRRAGHRVLVWRDDWWSAPDELPAPTDERVLFHGSLANAARIAALGRWDPGAYCATARLSCSAWYPQATRWLVNASHVFSTVRELVAEPERVAAPLEPTSGRVFIRPDGCLKPFGGRVVALAGLTPGHLDHGFYYDDLDLPIVIAPVQSLGREWRFVVAAGAVVASSAYEAVGRRADESAVPSEALELAEEIAAALPAPDPVFVLDLVETSAGVRLLELNPFSGADLYGCDRDGVVAALASLTPLRANGERQIFGEVSGHSDFAQRKPVA